MSRRKGEITARMNERNCPHIVQLPLPSGGFRSKSDDILAFHRERSIEPRRVAGGMTTSSITSASASVIRRTLTPSANDLVVRG